MSGSALASGGEGARWAQLAGLLVEHLDDRAILMLDPEGRVLSWGPGAERLLGERAERVLGRELSVVLDQRGARQAVRRWLTRARSGEYVERTSLDLEPRAGNLHDRAIEAQVVVRPLEEGEELLGFGVIIEVPTERAVGRLRDEIRRRSEIITLQQELAQEELPLEALMERIVARAATLTHADGAVMELLEGDELVHRAATGLASPHLGLRLPIRQSLAGLAIRTGSVLMSMDTSTDPRVDRASAELVGLRSIVVVPLFHKGRPRGTLKVVALQPGAFTEREVDSLELVAGFLAAALARAEDERRVGAANEARERLETVLESITDAFIAVDGDWRVSWVNQRAASLLKRPRERVLGREVWSLLSHDVVSRFRTLAQEVMDGAAPWQGELEVLDDLWLHVYAYPCTAGLALYLLDVTDRKRAERSVHKLNEDLASLIEASPIAIVALDNQGRVDRWNPAAEQIFGWSREEVVGRPLPLRVFGEHAEQALGQDHRGVIHEVQRKGGERCHVSVSSAPRLGPRRELRGVILLFEDVTQRTLAEADRQRLADILEATPDVVLTATLDGRLVYVNRSGRQILGIGEPHGRALTDLLHNGAAARILRDALPTALDHEPWTGESELIGASGEVLPVSMVLLTHQDPSGDTFVSSILRDMTARRRAEEHQRLLAGVSQRLAEQIEYDAVLDAIPDLVVPCMADYALLDVLDDDGQVRRARVQAADSQRAGDVQALQAFPPTHRAPLGIARVLRTGQPELVRKVTEAWLYASAESRAHRRALRQANPQSEMLVPLRARGRNLGALTLVRVGGAPYTEEELQIAVEVANRAALAVDNARLYEQTRDAVRTRDEVLRIVAHDLRNPLGVIGYSVDVVLRRLDDGPSSREVRGHLQTMRRAVNRAQKLVRDLLDVARIEARSLVVEARPVPIPPLLQELVEMHRPRARERQVELVHQVPPDLPTGCVDRDRLIQVLGNLVDNALQHTPPGGRVTLSADSTEAELCLKVQDTGEGIPPDVLRKVFVPFFQQRPGAHEGAGLGLAIARGIVRAHGGDISIESHVGVGTTVRLTVPVAEGALAR